MRIANREIGDGHPCYIVAELGINHNGNIEIAKRLIDAAIEAGCDAIKLQKREISICYSSEELSRPRESPFGKTNGDLKRGLEFGIAEYSEIDDYCAEKNIPFFASPWDTKSVEFLEKFDVPVYKIASACVTDLGLLERIADTKKPVIISTGMCELINVSRAYRTFSVDHHYPVSDIALLSCVSTYPAKIEELNLERIHTLKHNFPCIIGYSHHAVSPWPVLCAAVMGAKVVEAHITLDRSSWGSDQSSSLEPPAFAKLVTEIRDFEKARGSGEIKILESEVPIMQKLRRVGTI